MRGGAFLACVLDQRLQAVQDIRGAPRMGAGQDRALVFLQCCQPALNAGGMVSAGLGRQLQIGAQERRAGGWEETGVSAGSRGMAACNAENLTLRRRRVASSPESMFILPRQTPPLSGRVRAPSGNALGLGAPVSHSSKSAVADGFIVMLARQTNGGAPSRPFRLAKRGFDVVASLAMLPLVAVLGLALGLLNPRLNPGPLLFFQTRMGRDCRPFTAVKFRTMRPEGEGLRGHDDPLETDRIPPVGHFLRRTRIDETPQVWNVLKGEMSLIGPRPDVYEHGLAFLESVPGYRERHSVRPGISGLAQVRMGYAEGAEMTARKTRQDLIYIRRMGWRLEAYVFLNTLKVLSNGFGAR